MEKELIQIPVQQLKIGLYVSRLDRPWQETPFLFQGFEIESEQDLAQLRSLCKQVHVEVTRAEADELQGTSRPDPLANFTVMLANQAADPYEKDPVPLQAELAKARRVIGEARQAVSGIFDRIRRGGRLDGTQLDTVMECMVDSVFRNRDALSWLARMKKKDDYLYTHSLSSSVWALAFGRHLGLDKESIKVIGIGAMLLDIGKTQLADELLKSGAAPTDRDWTLLRSHVEHGVALVQADAAIDPRIKQMIHTHHERMDGSGYPQGLTDDVIPLVGRIAAIVDCYDAMTSDRWYAKGKSTYTAVLELTKLGGSWFQPELVELFIQAVGVFPTGTLVELNSGEVGVVIAQSRFRRLRPEIMLILDTHKRTRDEIVAVDLQLREQVGANGEPALWITRGLESGAHGIDPAEYFL